MIKAIKRKNKPLIKNSNDKRFHFRGRWKNGDNMVVCSYGKNKKDAWCKLLTARKQNKFIYKKGDNFTLDYLTNSEVERFLRKKGFSKFEAAVMSVHGHTCYIVKDGKVTIN